MFRLVSAMMRGTLPSLADFAAADRRRLGYLAEAAALLLHAPNQDELRAYAERARRSISAREAMVPDTLVPGGSRGHAPQEDALAAAWGFHPGLDVARYQSEAPALDAAGSG